jgi:predicted lipoprotein with Yx(FWY)xxD motif
MVNTRHLGRGVVIGAALVLSGAGVAAATSPPTEPSDDTAMESADTGAPVDTGMVASSAPAGGGPSACPAIPGDEEEATADTAAADTAAAAETAPAGTEAMTATTEAMATETAAPAGTAPAEGPFVQVAESEEYGPIVVDATCRSLYMFTPDSGGTPTCVEDCAVNWPPLTVEGGAVPPVADELDPALFTIVEHPESGPQLAFNGWPLYYFAGDAAPGDVNGQGVGGNWWLISSTGTPLEEATEESAPAEGSAPVDTGMGTMPMDTATGTTG